MAIKLKKNESFYIREGWFEKALNAIAEDNTRNVFYKNNGIKILGIGSNMVKSLKYWLKAANIIDTDNKLTEFGLLLFKYDRYLEDDFSWFLIHYFMTINKDECPVTNAVFNSSIKTFDKTSLNEMLFSYFNQIDNGVNKKYIESDVNVFIKSYINEDVIYNPEDNYICPLSALKLLKKERGQYKKSRPQYTKLSHLIVLYGLLNLYGDKAFDIEEAFEELNSPSKVFNLDKYMFVQYLEEMRRAGLVTINKTAGLNTVYPEKIISLDELFSLNSKEVK